VAKLFYFNAFALKASGKERETGLWDIIQPIRQSICRQPDYFPHRDFVGVSEKFNFPDNALHVQWQIIAQPPERVAGNLSSLFFERAKREFFQPISVCSHFLAAP